MIHSGIHYYVLLELKKENCAYSKMADEEKILDKELARVATEQKLARRQPLRQFKKCKSATFTLDGMNYTIGGSRLNVIYS